MENTVIVTVKGAGIQPARDLEIPTSIPVYVLAPAILGAVGNDVDNGDGTRYTFAIEGEDKTARPDQTLSEVGVVTGDIIILQTEAAQSVSGPALISKSGEVFRLRGAEILVGRPDDQKGINNVGVDLTGLDRELTVSRRHAQIFVENGVFHVLDLRSYNGTMVNGKLLIAGRATPLKNGDHLQFGDIELIFSTDKR